MYAKENQDQKLKVDKLVASNGDEWDIKNGVRSIHALSLLDPCPKLPKGGPPSALAWNTDLVEQKRMLEESERMILDTNKRLGAAVQELRDLVVSFPPTSRSPSHLDFVFSLPSSLQVQSKADPALAETQELLDAQGEMEVATL